MTKKICAIARSRRGASTGFFREALRPSGADRQGGGPTPPARAKVAKHRVWARVKGSVSTALSSENIFHVSFYFIL